MSKSWRDNEDLWLMYWPPILSNPYTILDLDFIGQMDFKLGDVLFMAAYPKSSGQIDDNSY